MKPTIQYKETILKQSIDECSTGEHNCANNAACFNTKGSFTCSCNRGYTGDGQKGEGNDCIYSFI